VRHGVLLRVLLHPLLPGCLREYDVLHARSHCWLAGYLDTLAQPQAGYLLRFCSLTLATCPVHTLDIPQGDGWHRRSLPRTRPWLSRHHSGRAQHARPSLPVHGTAQGMSGGCMHTFNHFYTVAPVSPLCHSDNLFMHTWNIHNLPLGCSAVCRAVCLPHPLVPLCPAPLRLCSACSRCTTACPTTSWCAWR
jgi:hypothetical protein